MKEKTKRLYEFITEYWLLIKNTIHLPNNSTEDEWYQAIESAGNISAKYSNKFGNTEERFCFEMVQLWLVYMNNRVKENRGEKLGWYNERIRSDE